MKKNFSLFLIAILMVGIVTTNIFVTPTYAASTKCKKLNASVETITPTTIKLSWKSHKSVVKWKVQIGELKHPKTDSAQMKGTFQTVATLKKGSTAYTIKGLNKDNYYYFRILGYTKNKGKLVLTYKTYEQQLLGRTGISDAYFFYDEYMDYYFTPTEIGLPIAISNYGLKPDYYQIYRKDYDVSGSEYKKIATLASDQFYYTDKSVLSGKSYLYKIRSYKIINKKKVYSTWSSVEKLTAVNQYGSFSLKKIATSEGDKILTIKLTSDKEYNADLCFLHNNSYNFSLKMKDSSDYIPLDLISYSKDGIFWIDVVPSQTDITLSGNEGIYLKLKITSDANDYVSESSGIYMNMIYNNIDSFLNLSFGESGTTDTAW